MLRAFVICGVILFALWRVYSKKAPDWDERVAENNPSLLSIAEDEGKVVPEPEAVRRWQRSILILQAQKVPYSRQQPLIETVEQSTRRTSEEVARRAMALCAVALRREVSKQESDKFVEQHHIASWFSPKEKEFIENPNPSEDDMIQFSWRYECYWVMLWSLGYVNELEEPRNECDVDYAISILVDRGPEQFIQKATLRSQSELLDATDLLYRYHWAVRDAAINGKETPAGLNGDVVMERLYALNWLVGYGEAEWDDVPTDT